MDNLNSLPTLEREPYSFEYDNNQRKVEELFNKLFPNLVVPCEYIYEILHNVVVDIYDIWLRGNVHIPKGLHRSR